MSGHGISVEVIERDANHRATQWQCKTKFVDVSYEATEDKWRRHVYEITGAAPRPMGGKSGRWTP